MYAASRYTVAMPPHIYIDKLHQHVGEEVTLKGWLYGKRSSGKIHFLQVRDGTGIVQCVASKADAGEEPSDAHGGEEERAEDDEEQGVSP